MKNSANGATKAPNQIKMHLAQLRALLTSMAPAHIATWMNAHRHTYPSFLFWSGVVGLGILFATIAMHAISTGFGVITEDVVMQAGTGAAVIAFLVVSLIMMQGTHRSFVYVLQTWNDGQVSDEPKNLPANAASTAPTIAPDILVYLRPGMADPEFAQMAETAADATTHAIWAAIIPPFKNTVAISTGQKETDYIFTRGDEPFADSIKEEENRVPAGMDHTGETMEDYLHYVNWFAFHYSRWRDAAKLQANPGRAMKTIIETIKVGAKESVAAVALILLCLPIFGQSKSRQVDEALGTRIREIPKSGAKVEYRFLENGREKTYHRTGDGKSDYVGLLQKSRGIVSFDDRGGQLATVVKDGELVCQTNATAKPVNVKPNIKDPIGPNGQNYLTESNTGDAVRPRVLPTAEEISSTPTTGAPTNYSFPDSANAAAMVEGWKGSVLEFKEETRKSSRPYLDFSWWLFLQFLGAFVFIGAILWFFAKTASEEGIQNIWGENVFIAPWLVWVHQNCSAALMVLLWAVWVNVFIQAFVILWNAPFHVLVCAGLFIVFVKIIRSVHNRIVPNIRVLGSGGANPNQQANPARYLNRG